MISEHKRVASARRGRCRKPEAGQALRRTVQVGLLVVIAGVWALGLSCGGTPLGSSDMEDGLDAGSVSAPQTPAPSEPGAGDCVNWIDDDGNGDADCDDVDCVQAAACAAPPLDQSAPTSTADMAEFLYTDEDSAQKGVDPAIFEAKRIAVVRGQVVDRAGQFLAGVRVTVVRESAYGYTETDVKGAFNLVINGGGRITVQYEKAGFLPAQRTIQTEWQSFHWVPEVVLLQRDPVVTEIHTGVDTVQVAQGSPVEDESGARQVTLLFPAGVNAHAVDAEGQTVPLTKLSVRATEYTAGERGPQAMPGATRIIDYVYDALGRIIGVIPVQSGGLERTHDYDDNGNRFAVTENGETIAAEYDAQDRLLRVGATEYIRSDIGDRVGKLDTMTGEATGYVVDEFGNLRSVTLPDGTFIEYIIDGLNRRVGKRVNGELQYGLLYADGRRPIARLSPSGDVEAVYIYATLPHAPDLIIEPGGNVYRIIHDHVGSPRLVVNPDTCEVVQRIEYDEFGRVLLDTNPGFSPFGFAGGLYDPDTGLVRLGARDYDAEIGRWTSKDPAGFGGGDTNLYAYAGSDPVNYVDPNGEIAFLLPLAWAIAQGAVVGATIDGGIELATQLIQNGGDLGCVDWGDVGVSAGTGAAMGVAGRGLSAIKGLKAARGRVWNPKSKKFHDPVTGRFTKNPQFPGNDPAKAPTGFEWRGKPGSAPGSKQGNYYNPKTGESLRPDLSHPDPVGPHWDYRDSGGNWFRIGPDGSVTLK